MKPCVWPRLRGWSAKPFTKADGTVSDAQRSLDECLPRPLAHNLQQKHQLQFTVLRTQEWMPITDLPVCYHISTLCMDTGIRPCKRSFFSMRGCYWTDPNNMSLYWNPPQSVVPLHTGKWCSTNKNNHQGRFTRLTNPTQTYSSLQQVLLLGVGFSVCIWWQPVYLSK